VTLSTGQVIRFAFSKRIDRRPKPILKAIPMRNESWSLRWPLIISAWSWLVVMQWLSGNAVSQDQHWIRIAIIVMLGGATLIALVKRFRGTAV